MPRPDPDFMVRLARDAEELEAAQHLRYRVFVEEMGARLPAEAMRLKRDFDRVDAYCDHLLVLDTAIDGDIEDQIVAGHTQMNKNLTDIAERIEEQVVRVDQAMEVELSKALTTFGQQLAALSEKFVADYAPLTDKLRDVVELAKKIDR